MTTRIRHLITKLCDDSTDPAQLIARRVGKSMDFWDFSVKKNNDITKGHTSQSLKNLLLWLGTIVPGLVQIQRRVSDFQKSIPRQFSKENPIGNSFFSFRN